MSKFYFREYIINNVLKGISEQVNYDLVCKVDQVSRGNVNNEETHSVGMNILLRTSFRDVEVIQCAPFYLTVTGKGTYPGSKLKRYFFGIGHMGNTPRIIHVSLFETIKLDLEMYIEHLENSGYFDDSTKTCLDQEKNIHSINLSNIEFAFHNYRKECIVYINGARVICLKYGASLKRFVSHF